MIWGMERVFRVARYYSRGEIDLTAVGVKWAEDYLRLHLFEALLEAIGEESIHIDDTKIWRRDTPFGQEVKMTWSPCSTEVELYGGPNDGQLIDVGGEPGMAMTGRIIRVPVSRYLPNPFIPPVWSKMSESLIEIQDYGCGGFNDATRRWLFCMRGNTI